MIQEKTIFEMEAVGLNNLVKNYADYNLWTNLTLINWLKSKPTQLLEKEVTSSFSSILSTLHHMHKTQGYWFSIVNKKNDFDETEYPTDLQGVLAGIMAQSAQIADFVTAMTITDLVEPIPVESPWFTCELSAFEYIMQFVNHNTYHRGQIVTIGRHLGFVDAPMTDYNFYNIMGK